jgi:hypothetical protein
MMRKLRVRSLLCLWLSSTVVLSSSLAFAAPPVHASTEDDATVAMARERFKEGVSFFDLKQYDKARAAFLQAYALKKHPAVLLNLAQSELRSGHEADAAKHFAAYLRESKDASDAEKQAAEAGLTAAKVVVAEVEVSVDASGAEVYVDGALEGTSPLPGPAYMTAGSHSIEARKDGRTAATQVNATAGKHLDTEIEFAPKPAPKPEPVEGTPEEAAPEPVAESSGRKPFFKWLVSSPVGVVGLGLTGVGAIGGGIFAIVSKTDYDNANSVASAIISNAGQDAKTTTPNTSSLCLDPSAWLKGIHYNDPNNFRANQYSDACSKYQKDVHNGDTSKTVATVGFVVAGVAAVGTVVYYFVDPSAKEGKDSASASHAHVALVPTVAPGQSGLTLLGSF